MTGTYFQTGPFLLFDLNTHTDKTAVKTVKSSQSRRIKSLSIEEPTGLDADERQPSWCLNRQDCQVSQPLSFEELIELDADERQPVSVVSIGVVSVQTDWLLKR